MAYGIVLPEMETLTLSEGDTIIIRKRLNTGELRRVVKRTRELAAAGSEDVEYAFQLTIAHLVDWSTPSGKWPPIAGVGESMLISTINGIDPDDYGAIKNAIIGHMARLGQEREDAKKKTTGTPNLEPISPLPSDVTGALIGSVP